MAQPTINNKNDFIISQNPKYYFQFSNLKQVTQVTRRVTLTFWKLVNGVT